MSVKWQIQTSTASPGAVAVVQVCAGTAQELESALRQVGIAPVPVGRVVLRDLCGIDRGIMARFAPESAHLMPHGGPAVLRLLGQALNEAGFVQEPLDVRREYPEAASLLEARMLRALAQAASPLAIDLLLDQPRRWPADLHDSENPPKPAGGEAPQILNHLIQPPLVVALGPANVGKSSLVNALAGRGVSIVADQPGTTRDHVGVTIDLAGLVVRYIDTPGLRPGQGAVEQEAVELALGVARQANLILACGDATAEPPRVAHELGRAIPALRVALRVDLGLPAWNYDVGVSVKESTGLAELVKAAREALAPEEALRDPRPWRFWEHP